MIRVVTYEDRPNASIGVELLALSLLRHAPELSLEVHSPLEEVGKRLADLPNVYWVLTDDLIGQGWNTKPTVILRALEKSERVFWLDTDVIISGPLKPLLARIPPGTVAVGTEYPDPKGFGSRARAMGQGLTAARSLPHSVNSGTLSLDRSHRTLLRFWRDAVNQDAYLEAQNCPAQTREIAFGGDQDVLWAALVSEQFVAIPVHHFRLGHELILQEGANRFHVRDRLIVLRGARPSLVHMLGQYKPWDFLCDDKKPQTFREYMHRMIFETSPYFFEAVKYTDYMESLKTRDGETFTARAIKFVVPNSPALQGFIFALIAWGLSKLQTRGQ